MRRTSLVRVLVAPTVALLVLTGCGSSGEEASGGASSSESPQAQETADAGGDLTREDFGERVASAFREAGTVQFTLSQTTAGQTSEGTGEGDLSQDEIRSKVLLDSPQGQIEAIAVDGLFYLKLPQLTGEKYVEVDPDDESGLGALVGQLGGNSDPAAQIEVFGEATEVTAQEEEDVAGVATTRYRVVLPGDAIAESLGADPRVAELLPEEVDYLVWVDGEDLVRRLTSELTVQGTTSSTEIEYTGFGEAVDIAAPPASEVTSDVPGLNGTLGS